MTTDSNQTNQDPIERSDNDVFADLFEQAAVRPQPASEAKALAFQALHSQWQGRVRKRMFLRAGLAVGLAASVLASFVVILSLQPGQSVASGDIVATVSRIVGDELRVSNAAADGPIDINDMQDMDTGSVLTSGPGSRLALDWHRGGSLRMDENTELEILSAASVRLIAGGLYYDSNVAASSSDASPQIIVQTSAGRVSHIGTQFITRKQDNRVTISVREGRVEVVNDRTAAVAQAGDRLELTSNGDLTRSRLDGFGSAWHWVESVAPFFDTSGGSTYDLLAWAGREMGRRVVYHGNAEHQARMDDLVGIENVNPREALRALSAATGLRVEVGNDTIDVNVADPIR